MKFKTIVCALALLPAFALAADGPTAKAHQAPADAIVPLVRIDDFNLTNLHFSVFAAQQREDISTREQQIRLLNELVNTFMVAHSEQGKALLDNPEIKSAMEVANARLVARAVIQDVMDNAKVTEAEIQARYQEQYANSHKLEYKARHILLKTEDEAKAVIAELDKGADFEQLAKERSIGPSSSAGGDLGWFTPDSMVKPFADAVSTMQDGEYSKAPTKTRFGWHVILREKSRQIPTPEPQAVRDDIVEQIKNEQLSAFVKKLRAHTDIEVIGQNPKVTE